MSITERRGRICRTLLITKKVEVTSQEEMKGCLKEVKSVTAFYTKGGYGTVVVKFTSKEKTIMHFTVPLKTAE